MGIFTALGTALGLVTGSNGNCPPVGGGNCRKRQAQQLEIARLNAYNQTEALRQAAARRKAQTNMAIAAGAFALLITGILIIALFAKRPAKAIT